MMVDMFIHFPNDPPICPNSFPWCPHHVPNDARWSHELVSAINSYQHTKNEVVKKTTKKKKTSHIGKRSHLFFCSHMIPIWFPWKLLLHRAENLTLPSGNLPSGQGFTQLESSRKSPPHRGNPKKTKGENGGGISGEIIGKPGGKHREIIGNMVKTWGNHGFIAIFMAQSWGN